MGVLIAVVGVGSSLIFLQKELATGTPPEVILDPGYDSWIPGPMEGAIVGAAGLAILAHALLFSVEPELELGEDESIFFRAPVWASVLVTTAGLTVMIGSFVYAALAYPGELNGSPQSGDLYIPILMVTAVPFLAFVVFLAGLSMLARRVPMLHFKGVPPP